MTEDVYWQSVQAVTGSQDRVKVTIVTWDYENKRGTALLPDGKVTEVAIVSTLTVVEKQEVLS